MQQPTQSNNGEWCIRISNVPNVPKMEQLMYESLYEKEVAIKAVRRLETESFCSRFMYLKNTSFEAHVQLARNIAHKKFTFRPQTTDQDADIRPLYPEMREARDLPEWVENWSRKDTTNGATLSIKMRNGQPGKPGDRVLYHGFQKQEIHRDVHKREVVAFGMKLFQQQTTSKNDIDKNNNNNTKVDATQTTDKSDTSTAEKSGTTTAEKVDTMHEVCNY